MGMELMNLSIYDDSFPMKLLETAFQNQIEESKKVTNRVIEETLRISSYSIDDIRQGKEKIRLVVDGSDEFLQDYQNGVIKLAKENGYLVAQIKENGKYGKKLAIKEEIYSDGPNSIEIMNAYQLQGIADSLKELYEQIEAIDENIKEVLRGQQNDRLGLYYSGLALFIESEHLSNDALRSQMISQSLKTLTDAKYQLILNMQSDINYLQRREYESNKRKKFNLLNEKINNINKSFSAIHQSMLVKAGIYCTLGEIKSMKSVFTEYALFIKNTIEPNYKLLSQCDIRDTGKKDGTWSRRAQLLGSVINIIEQLYISNNVLSIEYQEAVMNESN